jgi:prophage regulatory protein
VSMKILRLPDVKVLTGMSRSTIYGRMADGLFPGQVRLGPRMVGWPEVEVLAINRGRMRGATEDQIRALVAALKAARLNAA